MAVDTVAVIVRTLLNDQNVQDLVGDSVFGGYIPAGSEPPLILVRSVARRPSTKPTTQWWDTVTAVDVHSEDAAESFSIAEAAEKAVNTVEGTQPEGVVAVCEATGIASLEDGAYTPTRYRNVVTVEATARNS